MSEQTFDNSPSRPQTPNPRLLELNTKAKAPDGLTPREEGERRGLFAHPDNPEAQGLLQKEYLSSLDLGEMNDAERERLRVIRAENHARKLREEPQIEPTRRTEDTDDRDRSGDQAQARSNELHILYTQAKIASLKENWQGDPKTIIDRMVDDIPDEVTVYAMDTLGQMPKDEPKPLELYLLSHARSLPEFTDSKPDGALSVMESMRCLRDEVRTKKFLLGIREAIADLDATGTDVIRMCDAGTGAIPILAIYAALCSDKVRCEALELNPNAAQIAQEVIKEFGLQDRIHVRQADATKFQPEEPLDFLVSETMHSGLTAEPIVQILSNLQPHVKDSGITLPSRVNVQASLISLEDYASPNGRFVKIYGDMHPVTEQEWQAVADYRPGDDLDEIAFTLPTGDKPKGNYMVGVTCSVDVGSQHIAPYQSLITMPQYIRQPNSDPRIFALTGDDSQEPISVQYKPGETLEGKEL